MMHLPKVIAAIAKIVKLSREQQASEKLRAALNRRRGLVLFLGLSGSLLVASTLTLGYPRLSSLLGNEPSATSRRGAAPDDLKAAKSRPLFSVAARNDSPRATTLANSDTGQPAQTTLPEFKQRLRVFVHPNDIRPKVLRAWPGKAVISIENETKADLSLQMELLTANRTLTIGSVNVSGRSRRLPREVNLVAGEYVIYEASHPAVRCKLIVAAR